MGKAGVCYRLLSLDKMATITNDSCKNPCMTPCWFKTSHWRHNGRDGVSNHQPHDCLPNRLIRCWSKKTSKLRVTGLCVGNSPVTGEFPAQRASNAENVSNWWRHHAKFHWLTCVSDDLIKDKSPLIPVMACYHTEDKLLPKPMTALLTDTHMYSRPSWWRH